MTLIQACGDTGPGDLNDLNQENHQDNGDDHHSGFVPVVAVANGEVTDPAASDQTCHRRVANEADRHDGD